jgi:uncharacterized protein YggE
MNTRLMSLAALSGAALCGAVLFGACGAPSHPRPAAAGLDARPLAARPLAALPAAATVSSTTSTNAATGVTVDAVGRVDGTPDTLTVTIGVHTQAARATDALTDNSRRTADLLAALKSNGVADKDLQTAQLSLQPTYQNNGVITGYQVDNTVTAKLRDLAHAGALIDAAAAKVGDAVRIQGLAFSIDDSSALVSAARKAAVAKAKAQATELADAAGAKLGAIRSITETQNNTSPPYPMAYADKASAAASVPIQPGSQTLEVQVTVVWDLAS